jgi:putative salt-induced outer membrane protein YdiY
MRPLGPALLALATSLLLGGARPHGLPAQTILNVERLQPRDVSGWHWGVEGAVSVEEGNAESVDVLSGVVLGHRWTDDWLRAFVGLDYRSEEGQPLDRDRYLHLRLNHRFAERWQTFHFLQLQDSRRNLLRRRVLLGGGLRRRLVGGESTLDVGTGIMWESEELDGAQVTDDHPVEADLWRMANLVAATRRLSESVRLLGVAYFQPDLSRFGDFRFLLDVSLRIALTDNLALTVNNEWRHDSRPPGGVRSDDYLLSTGFALTFR